MPDRPAGRREPRRGEDVAHETAVMLFPTETYVVAEAIRSLKPTYATTPPRPRAPPVARWRRCTRTTSLPTPTTFHDARHLLVVDQRRASGPEMYSPRPNFERASRRVPRADTAPRRRRSIRRTGAPHGGSAPPRRRPGPVAVPRPGTRAPVCAGGICVHRVEVVGAGTAVVREPLVGFEDEPDSEEEAEREAARDTNAAQEDSGRFGSRRGAVARVGGVGGATAGSGVARTRRGFARGGGASGVGALLSRGARSPLRPRRFAARTEFRASPSRSARRWFASTRRTRASRAREGARREDARARHAARALTASVLRSVAATEAERLEAAEAREHARRLNPPFDEAEWRAALDHLAADAPRTESGAVPSPPTIAFRVARSRRSPLAGDATFGTFDVEAIEAAAAAEEGEGEGGAGDDANANPVGVPSLDPPTRRAVRERLAPGALGGPEGARSRRRSVRRTRRRASRRAWPPSSSTSSFRTSRPAPPRGTSPRWTPSSAPRPRGSTGVTFATRTRTRSAPRARAFAARALRWSRGVVAIVEARARARRAEARRARRAEAREERRRERRRARKERGEGGGGGRGGRMSRVNEGRVNRGGAERRTPSPPVVSFLD